jgi:hypothetical protein
VKLMRQLVWPAMPLSVRSSQAVMCLLGVEVVPPGCRGGASRVGAEVVPPGCRGVQSSEYQLLCSIAVAR